MKIRPLPPLNSLVAFEATARHLSFTRAAQELHLTQGAISRQVRNLETFLNRSLFDRRQRHIELTAAGLQYFNEVRVILNTLADATASQLHWQGERQVTVAATNAIASMWLMPRISEFRRQYQDVDIRLLIADRLQDLDRSEYDLAVYYYRILPPGIQATALFPEVVFPVCSPDYLRTAGALETTAQLMEHTLLYMESAPTGWVCWPEWLAALGMKQNSALRYTVSINNYPMLIQAATAGQGIALAWQKLIDSHLKSGVLIKPLSASLRTNAGFYLLDPHAYARTKPAVQLLRDWLLACRDDASA